MRPESAAIGWRAAADRPRVRVSLKPIWLVAILGLVGCLPLVLLTPPLQVPDEGQHFARAYQISEGHLWSEARGGHVGADLPASIGGFIVRFLGTSVEHAARPVGREPLAETLADRARPLAPATRAFLGFEGAAFYSPLPYLPQALAIGLGRRLDASPLDLLYAGRLANAVASLALLMLAMALAPSAAPAFAFVGLLPMTLYEDASLAPDGMVVACALVFVAIGLRAQARGRWSIGAIVAATMAGLAVCSLKPVYAPLLLAALFPDVPRPERRAEVLRAHAFIVLGVVLLSGLWMRSTASVFVLPRPGTSVAGQVGFVAGHPVAYLDVLWTTLRIHWLLYYESAIGVFGWVKIAPPPIFYILPLGAMLASAAVPGDPGERSGRAVLAWHLALAGASALLVLTALYVIWTPVGAPVIEGVQGRYFIPVLPLVGLALFRLRPCATTAAWSVPALFGVLAAQILIADLTIVDAYAVFG